MKGLFTGMLLMVLSINAYAQKLTEVWRTDTVFKSPESVIYDAATKTIFVANINGKSDGKDGNGFITQLNADGSVKQLHWIMGLNAPKGMAIVGGKLYVADIDELVEISIKKAKIEKRYAAPQAVFLNDVAAAKTGEVYVSDSRINKIYLFKNGMLSEWLEDESFDKVNGLFVESGFLYIGSKVIHRVLIKSRKMQVIQEDCSGIDGLEKDGKGNFIFSNWIGRIYYLEENHVTKMLDLTQEKINTADIHFASDINLVLVPTFLDNRVIAYRLD